MNKNVANFIEDSNDLLGLSLDHLFTDLDEEFVTEITSYVDQYNVMFEAIKNDKSEAKHGSSLMLFNEYLRSNKLSAPKDFYSELKSDDIIEVYTVSDIVQQWRSLNFHKHCSYSLRELLSTPFHELFSRPESINKKIIEGVGVVAKTQSIYKPKVEDHFLTELSKKRRFLVKMGILAPLFDKIKILNTLWRHFH